MLAGQLRQGRGNLLQNRPGKEVVALDGEVDVFVEEIIARHPRRSRVAFAQGALGVGKTDVRRLVCGSHLADNCIDPRVGAKPQHVQVAGQLEAGLGFNTAADPQQAARHAELKFRVVPVDRLRRLVLPDCILPVPVGFQGDACLVDRFPFRQIFSGEVRAVQRSQRRQVAQVDSHAAQDDRCSCPAGDAANVGEVPPIVVVNGRQPRIIGRRRVAEEHFHAGPAVNGGAVPAEGGDQVVEQLAAASRLQPHAGANHVQARHPSFEHGSRAVGPNHFIISQIDQEKVRLMDRAVASDVQGHVGVHRRHRRVDDLELLVRILLGEHDGEEPAEAERPVRKTLRSRSSQNKDANGSRGLGGKSAGIRPPRQAAGGRNAIQSWD